MKELNLTSMKATNPLGYLAALGAQAVFADSDAMPKLHWTNDAFSHAVITETTGREIVNQAMYQLTRLRKSVALNAPKDDLKMSAAEIKAYLHCASKEGGISEKIASALVAQGSLATNKKAKPTDFYFTAGQQRFLKICQAIISAATKDDGESIRKALNTDTPYVQAKSLTLMWDIRDSSNYALSASDPSKIAKIVHPGMEALAIIGLTAYPAFLAQTGKTSRTIAPGFTGTWKSAKFTYPIWSNPATEPAAHSLITHAPTIYNDSKNPSLAHSILVGWGVTKLLQSTISRSGKGGAGAFNPPEIIWQA